METLLLLNLEFQACVGLGRLRCIADHEVESAGRGFSKARIAVEGNGDAYSWILTGKLEAAFEQTVVDLIDMKRSALFTQQ